MKRFSPQRVKEARLEAGLTQSQLGRYSFTPEQNIGRWERGDNAPTAHNLATLAHILGKPIEFFFVDNLTPEEAEAQAVADRLTAA